MNGCRHTSSDLDCLAIEEWLSFEIRIYLVEMLVPPTRIERATRGLGNRCSIQLSYGGMA